MDVPRFCCPELDLPVVSLDADQARHARKALRLGVGAAVDLVDGRGGRGRGVIERIGPGDLAVRVTSVERVPPPRPRVTIAAAIPKAGRAEDMIDQLSQVGADRLVPLTTARSVVAPRDTKLERFRRRAEEAMKQCGRLHVLEVAELTPLDAVLAEPADLRLMLDPSGAALAGLQPRLAAAADVLALIGPEGGFTAAEAADADAADVVRVALPMPILRIETAAVVAAAAIRLLADG